MFLIRFFLEWPERPKYSELAGRVFDKVPNTRQQYVVEGCSFPFQRSGSMLIVDFRTEDLKTWQQPAEFKDGRLRPTGFAIYVDRPAHLQPRRYFQGEYRGSIDCVVTVSDQRVSVFAPTFDVTRLLCLDVLAGDVTLHD